jgi:predicted DNA-binding transcriptional regulator AlpA
MPTSDRITMPVYVGMKQLTRALSVSADTIERWIAAGRFPKPKPRIGGGRHAKRLWKWCEVEAAIDGTRKPESVSRDLGKEIRDYARAAAQGSHR